MSRPGEPVPISARAVAEGALLGGIGYAAALAASAVGQGLSPLYPLRAIAGIFSGNQALPDYGPNLHASGLTALFSGAVWIALLSLGCAATCALLIRRWRLDRAKLTASFVVWSLLWLGVGLLVFDHPTTKGIRRRVSSFQGLHELGLWSFVLAHVAFGLLVAVGLVRSRRPKKPMPAAAS